MKLTRDPLDVAKVIAETEDPSCGALVVFGGAVRIDDGVTRIDYTAYEPIAEKALTEVENEARERFGVKHCRVLHRLGAVELGELSVLVVVRAGHRPQAFEAARYAIDELKKRAPIWKEEFKTDGDSRFVEGVPLEQK